MSNIFFLCKSGVSFKQACHSSNINIGNSSLVLARTGSVSDTNYLMSVDLECYD